MSLTELLQDIPRFHQDLEGELTSWHASPRVLSVMQAFLKPGQFTLETGCGHSTVMFAAAGTHHWCITPEPAETERVTRFCRERQLSTQHLHFMVGQSQEMLPHLDPALRLDLVLIDGAHYFPIPGLDWYYANRHLRVGGTLVVDDLCIPTVRMLFDFLRADQHWRLTRVLGDTAFFQKVQHTDHRLDWVEQGYNRGYPDWSFVPHYRLRRVGIAVARKKGWAVQRLRALRQALSS